MYTLFEHEPRGNTVLILTLCLYYRPRSDTCKMCDSLNVQISAEEDIQAKLQLECELQLYHCKAEEAYQQLKEDTALCRTSSDVDMLTFNNHYLHKACYKYSDKCGHII